MYNFLVTADIDAWNLPAYEFGRDRFCEHTSDKIREQYKSLSASEIEELKSFPALFAYEREVGNVRVGYIRNIRERRKTVLIEYEFEKAIPEIPFSKIVDLKDKLDIGKWEMNRTHWAIKDEDLFEILFDAGLIDRSFLSSTRQVSSKDDFNISDTQIIIPLSNNPTPQSVEKDIKLNLLRSKNLKKTSEWKPQRPFKPSILIMKGGGIKGIAYVGALEVLEDYGYKFEHFVGSSAGAITAALCATGHSIEELRDILGKTDFNNFKDGILSYIPYNILRLPLGIFIIYVFKGLYKGNTFNIWLEQHLEKKFPQLQGAPTRLEDIPTKGKRLTVFASVKDKPFYEFDSKHPRITAGNRTEKITFACRCSMAIPYFFRPEKIEGDLAFDGGTQNNYPVYALKQFLERTSEKPKDFLGLYLKDEESESPFLTPQLVKFLSEARDKDAKETFNDRTIVINPRPISTLDFSLTSLEVEFLIAEGKASTLHWIYHWADGKIPTLEEVEASKKSAEDLREQVTIERKERKEREREERKKRFWTYIICLLLFFSIAGIGICYVIYKYFTGKVDQTTTTKEQTVQNKTYEYWMREPSGDNKKIHFFRKPFNTLEECKAAEQKELSNLRLVGFTCEDSKPNRETLEFRCKDGDTLSCEITSDKNFLNNLSDNSQRSNLSNQDETKNQNISQNSELNQNNTNKNSTQVSNVNTSKIKIDNSPSNTNKTIATQVSNVKTSKIEIDNSPSNTNKIFTNSESNETPKEEKWFFWVKDEIGFRVYPEQRSTKALCEQDYKGWNKGSRIFDCHKISPETLNEAGKSYGCEWRNSVKNLL